MSDDSLKIQKPHSTEVKAVKPENEETKTGEVKAAEIKVGEELSKTPDLTSDVDLSKTAKQREEKAQKEVAANLADIEAMADIPEDEESMDDVSVDLFPLVNDTMKMVNSALTPQQEVKALSADEIIDTLGIVTVTKDGQKIAERLKGLTKKDLAKINSTFPNLNDIKEYLKFNEVEMNFDNLSTLLEIACKTSLRTPEEFKKSENQRQKIITQIRAQELMQNLFLQEASWNDQYTDSIGLFGQFAEGVHYLTNKTIGEAGLNGEHSEIAETIRKVINNFEGRKNHYQWADYRKECAQRTADLKVLNPEKFKKEFKNIQGEYSEKYGVTYNAEAFKKLFEIVDAKKAQNPDGSLTDEYKDAIRKAINIELYNPNEDTMNTVMNGLGETILMLATLGWAAEAKGGQIMAQTYMNVFNKLGTSIASKQVKNQLLKGALRYTGKGVSLLGPMLNEGTKMGLYTLTTGTAGNVIDTSVKGDWENFWATEMAIRNASGGSFAFGAFAGLFGATVTQKVMQSVSKVSSKVVNSLSEKFAKGAVDASEVYATILQKSAPTVAGEVAAFCTDVVGFTGFEVATKVVEAAMSDNKDITPEQVVELLKEEFKGQGYNLGQIKIVSNLIMWMKGARSARKLSMKLGKDDMPIFKGVTVEQQGEGYTLNCNGRKIACKNANEMMSSLHLLARGQYTFDKKFDGIIAEQEAMKKAIKSLKLSELEQENSTPKKTTKEKIKDGIARTINLGNEIATEVAPILAVYGDKSPGMLAAIGVKDLASVKSGNILSSLPFLGRLKIETPVERIKQYTSEGLSIKEISEKEGVSVPTVYKWFKELNIQTPKISKPQTETKLPEIAKPPMIVKKGQSEPVLPEIFATSKAADRILLSGMFSLENLSEREIAAKLTAIHDELCEQYGIPEEFRARIKVNGFLKQKTQAEAIEILRNRLYYELEKADIVNYMDYRSMGVYLLDLFSKEDKLYLMTNEELTDKICSYTAEFCNTDIGKVKALLQKKCLELLNFNEMGTTLGLYKGKQISINAIRDKKDLLNTLFHETYHEYVNYMLRRLPRSEYETLLKDAVLNLTKNSNITSLAVSKEEFVKLPMEVPEKLDKWLAENLFTNRERFETLQQYIEAKTAESRIKEQQIKPFVNHLQDTLGRFYSKDNVLKKELINVIKLLRKNLTSQEELTNSEVQNVENEIKKVIKIAENSETFLPEEKNTIKETLEIVITQFRKQATDKSEYVEDLQYQWDIQSKIKKELKDFFGEIQELVDGEQTGNPNASLVNFLLGRMPKKFDFESLVKYIYALELKYNDGLDSLGQTSDNLPALSDTERKKAIVLAKRQIAELEGMYKVHENYDEYYGAKEEFMARQHGYHAELATLKSMLELLPEKSPIAVDLKTLTESVTQRNLLEKQMMLALTNMAKYNTDSDEYVDIHYQYSLLKTQWETVKKSIFEQKNALTDKLPQLSQDSSEKEKTTIVPNSTEVRPLTLAGVKINEPDTKINLEKATKEKIQQYFLNGLNAQEAAKKADVPVYKIYELYKTFKEQGLKKRPKHYAMKEELEQFLSEGKLIPEIAKIKGMPVKTMYNIFAKLGLETKRQVQIQYVDTIKKEDLQRYIDEGKTITEIAEILNVHPVSISKKFKEFSLQPKNKSIIESITAEDLQRYIDKGKTIAEIAEIYQVSSGAIIRKMRKFGVKTEQTIQCEKVANITAEDLKTYVDKGLTIIEIAKIYDVNQMSIMRKLYEFGLKAKRLRKNTMVKNLSKEYFVSLINQGKSVSDIAKLLNTTPATIYVQLKKFGIKTEIQLQKEIIDTITKEQFMEAKATSKNIKECCQKLGEIHYRFYLRLLEKFGIEHSETRKLKETDAHKYESYSVDELTNRIIEVSNCQTIGNNEKLLELIDFILNRKNLSIEEKKTMIDFVRLLDNISLDKTDINNAVNSETVTKIENWMTLIENVPDRFHNAMNILHQNNEDILANLCYEMYAPDTREDTNIKEAIHIIDIITKSKNSSEMKYRLSYYLKNAKQSVIEQAEEYSIKQTGKIDETLAGQYMFYADLYDSYLETGNVESNIPVEYFEVFPPKNIAQADIVTTIMKIADYYNSYKSKHDQLNEFMEICPGDTYAEKLAIFTFISKFYANSDTIIIPASENDSKQEFVLSSKVKQIILDKYPSGVVQLLGKFESSMSRYTSKNKENGIKWCQKGKKSYYEIKIMGDGGNRRLETNPDSNIFDIFLDDH